MRVMMLAFAAVVGIAILANYALEGVGFSSAERQVSGAVRLD